MNTLISRKADPTLIHPFMTYNR